MRSLLSTLLYIQTLYEIFAAMCPTKFTTLVIAPDASLWGFYFRLIMVIPEDLEKAQKKQKKNNAWSDLGWLQPCKMSVKTQEDYGTTADTWDKRQVT